MEDDSLKKYASRLNIHDAETIQKSLELLRLIKHKAARVVTQQAARMILSIELASILCGTDVDHRHAIKLSGLNSAEYTRQKDLIEKLLKLNKQLSLDEICAQLEINDRLKSDASQLFNEYIAKNQLYDDANRAPYMAMAIYQSLKLRKEKTTAVKSKLMQIGKITSKQWKPLEEHWDSWIDKCKPLTAAAGGGDRQKGRDRNESKLNEFDEPMDTTSNDANDDRSAQVEVPYEEWRDSMIAKAKAMLAAQQLNSNA